MIREYAEKLPAAGRPERERAIGNLALAGRDFASARFREDCG